MSERDPQADLDAARADLVKQADYADQVSELIGVPIDRFSFVMGSAFALTGVLVSPQNAHESIARNAEEFRKLAEELRR